MAMAEWVTFEEQAAVDNTSKGAVQRFCKNHNVRKKESNRKGSNGHSLLVLNVTDYNAKREAAKERDLRSEPDPLKQQKLKEEIKGIKLRNESQKFENEVKAGDYISLSDYHKSLIGYAAQVNSVFDLLVQEVRLLRSPNVLKQAESLTRSIRQNLADKIKALGKEKCD